MTMSFLEIVVLIGAIAWVAFSAYGQNVVTVFKQKGITTRCSKNAMKNVTIFDVDSGISYIGLDDQPVKDQIYKCTLYPPGEKHNTITIDIDFSLVRASPIEVYRKGTITLNLVRRENISVVFAANNNLFDEAPEVLYERLERLERDKIRMEAEIVELKAMKHQDVQKVLDTAKSLEMAKGQGRGGFTK